MKKKVCHITTVHPAKDVRIFHKECVSLAKAGYPVTLLVLNGEDEVCDGVNIKGIIAPFSGRIDRIRRSPKIALEAALKENADIYHFHDPEFLRVALDLKKAGKKVIYDVHEDVPRQIFSKYWIPGLFRGMISKSFEHFENYIASRVDYVITATPFIRERFRLINRECSDINNFPKLSEFDLNSSPDFNSEAVCYLGGIERIRGIVELVDSLNYCDAKLILAGKFSDASVKAEVQKKDAWKKVDFRGFQDREGVNRAMRDSFAGMVTLHPTINYMDSLPVKMFEYMAAGLPVIASNFPYWASIIEESRCGICVDPLDPKSIAKGINQLFEDKAMARQMGEAGRKAVTDRYNWNIEEKKLLAVYDHLANF